MIKTTNLLKAGAAPLALGLALFATPGFAQAVPQTPATTTTPADATAPVPTTTDNAGVQTASTDANDQVVVVTGSRIRRRDLESAAPVAVVQAEEFKLSGGVNAEQVLNALPQLTAGSTAFSNNPGGGVATLNLRNLGSTRNLVLVNGRRYMFYGTNQVTDINSIPTFLVDSTDVVTGGASAVYGSDAIAGVENFRLRNDLVGVELGGQMSLTGRGDGKRYQAYAAVGGDFADNKGHATLYGEYYKRSSIMQGARSYTDRAYQENSAANPTGLVAGGSPVVPYGLGYATYEAANCPAGNVFCSDSGAVFRQRGVASLADDTDFYNYAASNYLMVPQERYLVGGYGNYEFADNHKVYVEGSFVNNRVANQLAATPVTGEFNVRLASVQPFLSPAAFASLSQLDTVAAPDNVVGDGIVPLGIYRRVTETGGRNTLDERNAFRLLGGVTGTLTDALTYDAYYMYARTKNSNLQRGNISRRAFQEGLNGTATPINIFGPDTLTPDMVKQISITSQNSEESTLQVASASVSGRVFNLGLGAGDVGFALGGEYRKVAADFRPDTALSSGDVIGFNAGNPTSGSYDVKEIFGELSVPILSGRPFFEKLELHGAARYSDYSLQAVGGVWTYAGDVTWSPIRDLTLRGQYQHAVRAPNVDELFAGRSVGFPQANDPCAAASAATDPKIRALCIATGVPAASVGSKTLQPSGQIQGAFGGNAALQEEESDSYTAGIVFRPRAVPGFSATVDYYRITVDNAISTFGGGLANTLNLCYNVIQDVNSRYCQVFQGTRNARGQLDGTNPPLILNANIGRYLTEGVDFTVAYGTRAPWSLWTNEGQSKLNFSFAGNYTSKWDMTPVKELKDRVDHCDGKFGQAVCGEPTPTWKWVSRVSWIDGPATTSVRWRHVGEVKDDNDTRRFWVEKIPAYDLVDLSFAFDVTKQFSMTMGVNNLLDKTPTILGSNQEQSNTYPGTYDVLGRDFFVSARVKF